MQSFLKREIGILVSFVNIFEADHWPNHRHLSSHWFPFHWNLTNLWHIFANSTVNYASKFALPITSPGNRIYFHWKRPSILKWADGIYLPNNQCFSWTIKWLIWFFFSGCRLDGFPHLFSLLKTECLKIDLVISLSRKSPPPLPQHFLNFLIHPLCFFLWHCYNSWWFWLFWIRNKRYIISLNNF